MHATVFKIATRTEWQAAERAGIFRGTPLDVADGFIHFSTVAQVEETAAKHFAGLDGLVLVAIDIGKLHSPLKWEVSRGGALFPHLYGPLELAAVRWVAPLPLDPGGRHVFPPLEA